MQCHSQRRMELQDYVCMYIYIYSLLRTVIAGITLSTRQIAGWCIQNIFKMFFKWCGMYACIIHKYT